MKKLLALLLLISTTAYADVQYKTNDTPNTTSTIGTIPVYLNNGKVTAVSNANPLPTTASLTIATGTTVKIADLNGNVFSGTQVGTGYLLDVNVRAGTPSTSAVNINQINGLSPAMNVGTATAGTLQVVIATPSTIRLLDSSGNTISTNGFGAIQTQDASGSTERIADRLGNVFSGTNVANKYLLDVNVFNATESTANVVKINGLSPAMGVGTATAGTIQVAIATPSTVMILASSGNTLSSNGFGALFVQPSSGSTEKLADSAGNVFTQSAGGAVKGLDVVQATGSVVRVADRSGNTFTGSVTTGGNYAMDVKTATGSTLQSATGSVVQTIVGIDNGWTTATESTLNSVVQVVKSSKGNFGGYFFYNPNATAAYLQVFDAATAGTSTLTTLKMIIGLPATAGANMEWSNGISFNTGICVRVATTATGNTATSSAAEGYVAYK